MNGLGRYEEALAAAMERASTYRACTSPRGRSPSRSRQPRGADRSELAREALYRLTEHIAGCDTEWALGILARSQRIAERRGHGRVALPRGDRSPEQDAAFGRSSPAPTCSSANGSASRPAPRRRGAARRRTRCSPRSVWKRSPSEAAASSSRPARRCASAPSRCKTVSLPRRPDCPARERRSDEPGYWCAALHQCTDGRWHLGKVFAKLGVSSRKELIAVLPKVGLAALPA